MTGRPSISLHVERLVVDEALLAAGGERELRYALVEALEQALPGVIAGMTDGAPAGPNPGVRIPISPVPAPGRPARESGGTVPTPIRVAPGRPGALAEGVAGQVAGHVRAAIGGARSTRRP